MSSLLFCGNANPSLNQQVLKQLAKIGRTSTSSIREGHAKISKFSDGELQIDIEDNVRGKNAFILQPTCRPVNDSLMEMLLVADALRRSSAEKIIAVIPYYGYSRQDRRPGYSRVPISARVVADMIEAAKIDHVVVVDLHATQAQGFFNIPVDNIAAAPLYVADIKKRWKKENPIMVSPDIGGVARARAVAKQLNDMDLAIVDKRRPAANQSEVMNIIGDVTDKTCIMVDDMVDTAGTLCKAADALIKHGARRVVAYCTHPVLSGSAKDNLENSQIEQLIITNTIPLTADMEQCSKIHCLSIAEMLAETIVRIDNRQSIREILE